jgi:hypothetical protein
MLALLFRLNVFQDVMLWNSTVFSLKFRCPAISLMGRHSAHNWTISRRTRREFLRVLAGGGGAGGNRTHA